MIIKQLSVFLEDRTGRLTKLTKILYENDINITALSMADAAEYGIVRMIVGRPELAVKVLKENSFSVNTTDVIGIIVPNKPGGVYKTLDIISSAGIHIDYMYAYAIGDSASVVIRTKSNEAVIDVLQQHKMELLKADDIYQV